MYPLVASLGPDFKILHSDLVFPRLSGLFVEILMWLIPLGGKVADFIVRVTSFGLFEFFYLEPEGL